MSAPDEQAGLPPSLQVTPNIPWADQTIEQLRLERDYWERKVEETTGFASASVADQFRMACEKWIARREKEAEHV